MKKRSSRNMCFSKRTRRWLLLCCLFCAPPATLHYKVECCRPRVDIFKCIAATVPQMLSPYPNSAELCREANTPTTKNIAKSNVSRVQKDVDDDPNVRTIYLNSRDFSSILKPAVFLYPKQSSDLEYLSLRSCKIKELSVYTFAGLTKLKVLHLEENQLENLPLGIFSSLVNLHELWLNGNKFKKFDVTHFLSTTSMRILCLSSNVIEQLDSFPVSLAQLQELYLENNTIKEIDSKLLYNLTNLRMINLSRNKLKKIDENFFAHNAEIYSVDLKDNTLHSLPSGTFQHLCNLGWLDIRNNELTTPYFEWFANVVYRSKFYRNRNNSRPVTSGNRWNCDCSAAPYVDFIVKICYDPLYREKGLMKSLNIECSRDKGEKIVQRGIQSCNHKLLYCKSKAEAQSETTDVSCSSTPMCRFLTKTCGGNILFTPPHRNQSSRSNVHESAQQNQRLFYSVMIFGAVVALIILAGLVYFIKNKHIREHKQSELSISTKEWETDHFSSSSDLSEMKGYDNDHPPPRPPKPRALRPRSVDVSMHSSFSSFDVLYDSVADSTETLFQTKADTEGERVAFSTRPESVGSTGMTATIVAEQLYDSPAVEVRQSGAFHVKSWLELDSTLDEEYTPMRSQFCEEVL